MIRRLAPLLVLLSLILACGLTPNDEPPPPPPAIPPPPVVQPPPMGPVAPPVVPQPSPPGTLAATMFDGRAYALAERASNETGTINEYLPPGETFARWTRMLAQRRYANQTDPAAAAQRVQATMRAETPPRPTEVTALPDGRTMIYFVTWAGPVSELNLQIFQTDPGGRGLLELQYAERAYGEDTQQFIARMEVERPRLTRLLVAYRPPAILE